MAGAGETAPVNCCATSGSSAESETGKGCHKWKSKPGEKSRNTWEPGLDLTSKVIDSYLASGCFQPYRRPSSS